MNYFQRISAKVSYFIVTNRGVPSEGRVGRYVPLLLKILFFLNTKTEKSALPGAYSYSIYINEGITPSCYRNFDLVGFTLPLPWKPWYAPGCKSFYLT
jgi:hypothetical protein